MLLFTLSSIGLPGMNGFAGEFLILLGMFQRAWVDAPGPLGPQLIVIAVLAVSGVVLGAWYMLWLVQRVFFGPLKEGHLTQAEAEKVRDLRAAKCWPWRRWSCSSSGSACIPSCFWNRSLRRWIGLPSARTGRWHSSTLLNRKRKLQTAATK